MDNNLERDQLIAGLRAEDIEKLSDTQITLAQQVALKRVNKRAQEKVREVLKDKEQDALSAMTLPPFSYTSEELQIMAGMKVRFMSLNRAQVNDAYACADKFALDENPNGIRLTNELNRNLLAYSLCEVNGKPFGDVEMPEDVIELSRADPEGLRETMNEIKSARLASIDAMPSAVVDRLIEHYHAFQIALDGITKGEDLGQLLGN